jgi:hypothetical protein
LRESKSLRKSREDRFLVLSAAASLCRTATKVCDRFCVCGPSCRRARDAPARLKNFVRQPKRTSSTVSTLLGHGGPGAGSASHVPRRHRRAEPKHPPSRQQICSPPGRLARPKPSSAGATTTPNRNAINSEPRGASRDDITQDAQRHPWLLTRFNRAANAIDCPFHSFEDFRDGGFRFWNGIQAFVGERGQRDVIIHDLISRPTTAINQKLF